MYALKILSNTEYSNKIFTKFLVTSYLFQHNVENLKIELTVPYVNVLTFSYKK